MLNKDEESETTGDVSATESCFLDTESFIFSTDSAQEVRTDVDTAPPLDEVSFGGSSCTTESSASSSETMADTSDDAMEEASDFQAGNHVYTWCSLSGLPRAYSHHGIVVQVSKKHVKIIDFYPLLDNGEKQTTGKPSKSGAYAGSTSSGRLFTMSTVILDHAMARKEWAKVQYSVTFRESLFRRSGTWSSAASDDTGLVLSRVEFLQDNKNIVPRYDGISSNCECAAVWCKTGRFCSLQGASFLAGLAAGSQIAAGATAAGVAGTTVTVPAASMWGLIGCTTTVPLVSAPLLAPAIIAGGAVVTAPFIVALWQCTQDCKKITKFLNLRLAQGCREGLYLPHLPRFDVDS